MSETHTVEAWEKFMEFEDQLKGSIVELRKNKERKFDQTVDLIINLQKFDVKKHQINLFLKMPHQTKKKKVAAFLEAKNKVIDTITPDEFKKYSDKKALKKLVDKYDFFISEAKLMPKVATTFGRVLGPAGKMPSPQLGLLMNVNEKEIEDLRSKISNTLKIKVKESSIKVPVGKQSMKDEEIIENIVSVYNAVLKEMPREKENLKNVEVKFTMSKPFKIKLR